MPNEPNTSAAEEPAPSARKRRSPRRAGSRAKATVGKATPTTRVAKTRAANAASVKERPTAKAPADSRSRIAVARLQDAVDQLERVLHSPVVDVAEVAVPPSPNEPKSPPPPPPARLPDAPPDSWIDAMRPALATCIFLVIVGTLIIGYSVGYTMGGAPLTDPVITVASAAEKPPEKPVVEETPVAAELVVAPAKGEEEAPKQGLPAPGLPAAPVAAAPNPMGRLHLQVSALKSRQAAKRLGRKLESEGFPVQVREPEADGLVRVLVGPVDDREQLAVMADRLREEGLKPFPKRL